MGAKKLDELIDGFMNRLEQRNLIIVENKAANLETIQQNLLQKDALTPYEIAKYELLPYTLHGLKKYKEFKQGEKYKNSNGKWMIATSAVVRLRKKMQIV